MGEMTSLQTQQSYCQAAVGNPVFLTYRLREYLAMGLSRTDLCRQGLRLSLWGLYSIFPPTPLYSKVKVKVKLLSHVQLFVTPWNVAHQAPPSTEFSRQEYWSGLPFPSPVDLPNPDIEPGSRTLQADSLPTEPPGKP